MIRVIRKCFSLIHYPLRYWRSLLLIIVLTLLSAGTAALQPWPLKVLVDNALRGQPLPPVLSSLFAGVSDAALVAWTAAAAFVVYLLGVALEVALTWCWSSAGERMVYDLASDMFDRIQRLSLIFHARSHVGDSLSRLTTDSYCIYQITDATLVSPAHRLLTIGAITVIAWQLDPRLTAITVGSAPVLAAVAAWFGPRLKRRRHQLRQAQTQLMSYVHQRLSALPVIQAFNAQAHSHHEYEMLAQDAAIGERRQAMVTNGMTAVNGITTTTGIAIVLFVGGRTVLAGTMTLGSLLVFLQYARTLQNAFLKLFQTYGQLRTAEANIDRVREILDSEHVVREAVDAIALPNAVDQIKGKIEFDRVSFGYQPNQRVLKELSLTIQPGEHVALVGATGAGKTTLVSLIPRFFDPSSGQISFDGVDLRQLTIDSLRRQISLVLQDPFLLPRTVAENIAYGRADASMAQIVEAARAAEAHAFIERLPDGYETLLGEGGTTLSGGEQHRIAIARSVLNDVSVVILDEPTASLDVQTEQAVMTALGHLTEGRTTITIAHRLSTARRADRILVMEDGRLIEQGTHHQLMRCEGVYYRFYRLQRSDLIEETAV